MDFGSKLQALNASTGYWNLIKPPNPALSGIEQFLYQFGTPIMFIICFLLIYLAIKKQYEPL